MLYERVFCGFKEGKYRFPPTFKVKRDTLLDYNVCVCVCVWIACVCCVCVYVYCMYVCVLYVCVCVCMCVFASHI